MINLPLNDELVAVARRVIWFEEPSKALSEPIRFLAYAFERATLKDFLVLRRYVSFVEMVDALKAAPPGIIGPRSWAYWNVVAGFDPPLPLPRRTFAVEP